MIMFTGLVEYPGRVDRADVDVKGFAAPVLGPGGKVCIVDDSNPGAETRPGAIAARDSTARSYAGRPPSTWLW